MLDFMRRSGVEITRANYLDLAYFGEVPDPLPAEVEAELREVGL